MQKIRRQAGPSWFRRSPAAALAAWRQTAVRGCCSPAGDWPGGAAQPGGGARPEACGQDRRHTGARGRRMAQAARSIPITTPRDLRDRALIATLTYSFARINAGAENEGRGLRPHGVRLMRKAASSTRCRVTTRLPRHPYRRGLAEGPKGSLLRTARGHKADALSDRPMNHSNAWLLVCRRAATAGINAPIGCHTFRDQRDHRLSRQRRRARARAGNCRAREPAHDQAVRPGEGAAYARRGREDQIVR